MRRYETSTCAVPGLPLSSRTATRCSPWTFTSAIASDSLQGFSLISPETNCGIEVQVFQELYATLTRKLKPGFDAGEAQDIVRDLAVWRPVALDLAILERSWLLQQRYSLSWWDSLIVAAAHSCECQVLLTEDLQHSQLLGEVRVIDPFASSDQTPAELLQSLAR